MVLYWFKINVKYNNKTSNIKNRYKNILIFHQFKLLIKITMYCELLLLIKIQVSKYYFYLMI